MMSLRARVVAAIAVLLLTGFYNGGFHNWVFALIAVVLLATAYFGFCPAYVLIDKNTAENQPPADK